MNVPNDPMANSAGGGGGNPAAAPAGGGRAREGHGGDANGVLANMGLLVTAAAAAAPMAPTTPGETSCRPSSERQPPPPKATAQWLKMGGWEKAGVCKREEECGDGGSKMRPNEVEEESNRSEIGTSKQAAKNKLMEEATSQARHTSAWLDADASSATPPAITASSGHPGHNGNGKIEKYTSAAELEKFIRAIGTNPHFNLKQKSMIIQGLRDSVWKSNCRLSKRKREEGEDRRGENSRCLARVKCCQQNSVFRLFAAT